MAKEKKTLARTRSTGPTGNRKEPVDLGRALVVPAQTGASALRLMEAFSTNERTSQVLLERSFPTTSVICYVD